MPMSATGNPLRTLRRAAALASVLVLCLAGCGSSGGGGLLNEIRVRVLHFSPDAPRINVLVDGVIVRSALDYKSGTGFLGVTSGRTYDFAIDALPPTGPIRVIDQPGVLLEGSTEYTLVAVGEVGDSSVEAIAIENPIADVGGGQFRIRLLHATPAAPMVDVFLTEPAADLATAVPVATLDYKEFTDRIQFPTGTYQIRITPTGTPGTVIFDSGSLQFPPGRDLLVGVVRNTGIGGAPVSLVLDNGFNQTQSFDVTTPAQVRVLHYSSNTPAVQVTADPAQDGAADVNVTADFPDGLTFPLATAYQSVPADTYVFRGVEFATPATAVFNLSTVLFTGSRLSILFSGLKATDTTPSTQAAVAISDNVRPIGQVGQVRFIHGAPASGPVDVYILPQGTAVAGSIPVARSVALGVATAYFQTTPGDYVVSLTTATTTNVVASANIALASASAFTVLIRDAPGGGTPLGVEVENDLP
jgi:hypothetical protein